MGRRLLAIAAMLGAGLLVLGPRGALAAEPAAAPPAAKLRVGFVNPGMTNELFWELVSKTMRAAAAELDIEVDIRYTRRDPQRALEITRDFLAERPRPDYLIATNDVGVGVDVIKLCDAAGQDVLLLNNDIEPARRAEVGEPRTRYKHWLGSLTPNNEGAGYDIAETLLNEAVARNPAKTALKLLAVAGDADTPASVDRVTGLKRAVAAFARTPGRPTIALLGLPWLDWTEAGAHAWIAQYLEEHGAVDAVWAANDPMALGAIAALEQAGFHPGEDVVVGGMNWSQPAIDKLRSGELALSHGGHFLAGAWAMIVLRDLHDGRDFAAEDVRLQYAMAAITRPLAERYPAFGNTDWSTVDFTRLSKTRHPEIGTYNFTEQIFDLLPPPPAK